MSRTRTRERAEAFTLVEIAVAMLIMAILIGMFVMWSRSAQNAAKLHATIAVGQQYSQAVEQFASDHDGNFPSQVGTTDWPNASNGPRDPLARTVGNGRYLRSVPSEVTQGDVAVNGQGTWGSIWYQRVGDEYVIEVRSATGIVNCVFGSDSTAGSTQRCAN